jgi:SAM-dependent methyltransferase
VTTSHAGSFLDRVHAASRRRRFEKLLETLAPSCESTFLDVGVGNDEPLPVTNYVTRHYPWPERMTALGLGNMAGFRRLHPEIRTVSYGGGAFPFVDVAFDVVHSNAVLEHVGSEERQLAFLGECLRVGRSGIVTTPNRFFPIESHTLLPFLHWLGKERFDAAIDAVGPERIARGFARLGRRFPVDELADLRLLGAADLRRFLARLGARHARVVRNRVAGLALTLSVLWSAQPDPRRENPCLR